MITKWKVFNFKSIREETELDLGPLTILAGPNSSGKSTFIQSVLLVAQTLAHKVGSRSVVLNGTLTTLGQFDDLKSNNGESDQITIKCTCQPLSNNDAIIAKLPSFGLRGVVHFGLRSNRIREIACEVSFDADPSSPQRDTLQIQPRLFSAQLTCIARDEDNIDQHPEIAIRHTSSSFVELIRNENIFEADDSVREEMIHAVMLDNKSLNEITEQFSSAKPLGCLSKHFLPDRIIYSVDSNYEDALSIAATLQDEQAANPRRSWSIMREPKLTKEIISALNGVISNLDGYTETKTLDAEQEPITVKEWLSKIYIHPFAMSDLFKRFKDCDDLVDKIYAAIKQSSSSTGNEILNAPLPTPLLQAAEHLESFFSNYVRYLGPLRNAPKPLYPLVPATDPRDIGIRGEHTASILELHKNKKIRYIPSANFKDPAIDRKTGIRTLEAAVIDWLQYLGVASSVKSRDQGKLGHELKVRLSNSESSHDLTHVGVGVSQVLPILVMCLLADTDSTLIFEQPELHLHPKVQTLLGDFFLSMALCNKQCIVETHSEYLIDRLRFRIAASPDKELNSQAKIYFVEKTSQDSSFREVVINEYGAIPDWPKGFFDQSQQQAEEILRAAAMKRKASRRNTNA
jgi:predicted ATPase